MKVSQGCSEIAHNVALFGYKDRNIDSHLQLLNDIEGNIASDNTFYAKRYHVNTDKARSQIADIKRVVEMDLLPYFQRNFGLLGDPELTRGFDSESTRGRNE
ncbi:MAG TPA: hypothetical protein VK638_02415 [Edaphobacter sp.]|nr:hypothetical protein [Edaphobacter sp.]